MSGCESPLCARKDVGGGYYIQVSRAGPGVARFSFKELCGLPLVKHLDSLHGQSMGRMTQWYVCAVPL